VAFQYGREDGEGAGMTARRFGSMPVIQKSAFVGYRFPLEVIVLTLRWYMHCGPSLRYAGELPG